MPDNNRPSDATEMLRTFAIVPLFLAGSGRS
jgi:hypothetical protein